MPSDFTEQTNTNAQSWMLLGSCWHKVSTSYSWLYVTAVGLILCGQTLSEVAGGNFTLCKQGRETAEQSTPGGISHASNLRSTFLTSVATHTYISAMIYKRCEVWVTLVQPLGEKWSETTDWLALHTSEWTSLLHQSYHTFVLCLKKKLKKNINMCKQWLLPTK